MASNRKLLTVALILVIKKSTTAFDGNTNQLLHFK
jgi:hypothetical protein